MVAEARQTRLVLEARDQPGCAGQLDDAGSGGQIPRREPVRLEDDDVVVARSALHLAGDHLVQLVHLEPVEHAARDRLDQVARLELGLGAQVAADERRPLEHDVVELAPGRLVRADAAHERAGLEPFAAQHRVARCGGRDDDVAGARIAVRLARLAVVLAAEPGEPLGSRP